MTIQLTICVCTYRRLELLRRLLRSLERQVGVDHSRLEVVIVDNDELQSAASIAREFAARHSRVRYVSETRRNIALARNTAVANARGGYIAFIDDDEVADPNWLSSLVKTAKRTDADCVFGPVLGEFPAGAARWLERGGFFSRRGPGREMIVDWREARTGNVLMNRDLFTVRGFQFDRRFGLSGGEDADLFRRMHSAGVRFAWSPDATIHEHVEPERLSLGYLLRRRYRGGAIFAELQRREITRGTRVIQFCGRCTDGAALCVLGLLPLCIGRPCVFVSGLLRFALAIGGGVAGIRPGLFEQMEGYAPRDGDHAGQLCQN